MNFFFKRPEEFLKRPLRLMVLAFSVFILLGLPSFIQRVQWYLSGDISRFVIRNEWDFVFLNILFFSIFALPLFYRKKASWISNGLYMAFIVSLFTEMYGIPLTIYLTSGLVSQPPLYSASFVDMGIMGISLALDFWMLYGLGMMAAGMAIVLFGWLALYRAAKEKRIAMEGIYSQSRHPQYLGLLLIVWGWLVAWPTLLTIAMAPLLTLVYFRLARTEEKEMGLAGSPEYNSIPMFF